MGLAGGEGSSYKRAAACVIVFLFGRAGRLTLINFRIPPHGAAENIISMPGLHPLMTTANNHPLAGHATALQRARSQRSPAASFIILALSDARQIRHCPFRLRESASERDASNVCA